MKAHSDTACVAVDATVARLEGEVAAKDAALEYALAEQEALREGLKPLPPLLTQKQVWLFRAMAALSGAGEGWLEVREQARRAIELALEHGRFDRGFVVMRLSEAKAALEVNDG